MSDQVKHRIVGLVVVSFLALIILPLLFNRSPETTDKGKGKIHTQDFQLADHKHKAKPKTSETDESTIFEENAAIPQPEPMASKQMPIAKNDIAANDDEESYSQIVESEASNNEVAVPPPPSVQKEKKASNTQSNVNVPTSEISKPEVSLHQKESISKAQNDILNTEDKKAALPKPGKKSAEAKSAKNKVAAQTAKESKKVASTDQWMVQLGSFATKSNADNLVKELNSEGFHADIRAAKNSEGVLISRVFIGPEDAKDSAESIAKKLQKKLDLHGVVVKFK